MTDSPRTPSNTTRVFFAEDNPDHAYLIRRCLEPLGLDLHHASDGENALEQLQHWRGSKPDFVLLDLNLPRMSGLEVLTQLRASPQLKSVPVVVFSTSRLNSDVAKAYECGANSFIVKPAKFGDFRELLLEVANYWIKINNVVEGV
jgi:two-component system, chemotaxis family, response regulator Rcp1